MDKIGERAVIQYLHKKGLKPKDIDSDMVATLGKNAPSYATVKRWVAEFKCGRQSLEDDPHPGRPVTVATPEMVNKVHDIVMTDRRVTERYIASTVGISQERVHSILTEDLEMRKLSARWVPRLLTIDQKHTRRTLSRTNLNVYEENSANFLKRFVTMDETWVHHFTPETKQQSKQWKYSGSPPPKKAKTVPSAGKVMASVFWDADGILLIDYLQNGQMINGTYYASLLMQLREKIKLKRHGKLTKGVLFHRDNAPVHKSVIAMAAIHDCGFKLIEHPPYSPDLAPSEFHLFPKLKIAISGTHFQSNDDVINAVDDFLNGQEKNFFKSGTEALKHRWQKCIDTEGDYVEKLCNRFAKIHILQYEAHNISISPRSLQTTISNVLKLRNFINMLKGKILREKEKLLIMSNFSFSLNVFMNLYGWTFKKLI